MTFARSAKVTRPVVDIWSNMTVADVAACVKKETGMFVATLHTTALSTNALDFGPGLSWSVILPVLTDLPPAKFLDIFLDLARFGGSHVTKHSQWQWSEQAC